LTTGNLLFLTKLWIRIGPEFNQFSGSRRAKMTHKNRKKLIYFMLLSAGCSLLRAEGFPVAWKSFYGGQG
jgi:hypothetical protein